MKLLLVEDETGLRAALCRILENAHYDVEQAANGPEGLEHLLTGLYDAAVLDVMLPGLDGFAVLQRARAAGVRTPVLMLTARAELEDRVRGLDGGAD